MMNKKTYISGLLFLIIISAAFWIISPIGIDFEPNAMRIGELARELVRQDASFPVYLFKDVYNHYGYPIPIFYGSISLLPFALPVTAGLSVFSAYKLMIICVLWLAFSSAYLCLKYFFREREDAGRIAFCGAFFYAVNPFFLIEIFVRSANSGGMVFVFIPPVLLGYWLLVASKEVLPGILLLGAGMSGIITSHVTSTVIVVMALAVLYLVQVRLMDRPLLRTCRILLAALFCFLLSAWYLLPMLEQMAAGKYIGSSVHSLMIPSENFIAMLFPMHLSLFMSKVIHRDLPFSMIGGAIVSMIITVFWIWRRGYLLRDKTSGQKGSSSISKALWIIIIVYFSIVCVLLIHWTFIERYIAFIQFAWRIFLIAAVLESVMTVLLLSRPDEHGFVRFRMRLAVVAGIYVLVFFFGYHAVKNLAPVIVGDVSGHEVTSYSYSYESETEDELYLPVSVDKQSLFEGVREVRYISDLQGNTGSGPDISDAGYVYETDDERAAVDVTVTATDHGGMILEIPFIMYRGYSAVDIDTGEKLDVYAGDNGLLNVSVPAGYTGNFTVSYTGTTVQRISYYTSLAAGLLLAVAACGMLYGKITKTKTK